MNPLSMFLSNLFAWPSTKKTDSDEYFYLWAGLTVHEHATESQVKTVDPNPVRVFAGFGQLQLDPTTSFSGQVYSDSPNSPIGFSLHLQSNGQLTIGKLVSGKAFLGRPATDIPATALNFDSASKIISAVVPADSTHGLASAAVALTLVKYDAFIPV